MNREAIYEALFNIVQASASFATASRRLRHWADVAPTEQPAVFQVQRTEVVKPQTNRPPVVVLSADLYIYVNTGGFSGSVPSTQLNELIDAIDAALATDIATPNQTLGGLVTYARISGSIQTDEGVLGDQAVAIIPIEILANT